MGGNETGNEQFMQRVVRQLVTTNNWSATSSNKWQLRLPLSICKTSVISDTN